MNREKMFIFRIIISATPTSTKQSDRPVGKSDSGEERGRRKRQRQRQHRLDLWRPSTEMLYTIHELIFYMRLFWWYVHVYAKYMFGRYSQRRISDLIVERDICVLQLGYYVLSAIACVLKKNSAYREDNICRELRVMCVAAVHGEIKREAHRAAQIFISPIVIEFFYSLS